jgi:four helix bundle protein
MGNTRKFTDLLVWQKAHKFVVEIYHNTFKYPREELFCLTSQIRRSSVSIPANIAEGTKKSKNDFCRYLTISEGSLEETKYYLILSKDLSYITEAQFNDLTKKAGEIGFLLFRLRKSLA